VERTGTTDLLTVPCQRRVRAVSGGAPMLDGMTDTAAAPATRPHRVAGMLLADRHSLPLSIALHLVPGILIVVAYLLIAEPFVTAIGYPIFLAWAIALVVVLLPLLGGLLWLGRERNGRPSLRGVVGYLGRPIPRGRIIAAVAGLIVWMTVVSLALTPLDDAVFDALFTWIPFEGAGGSATTYLDGYEHSLLVTTMLIGLPLTGFSLPLIEELYFRGFLLPRIAHLGWRAPLLNTVLFSVYHFWAPWTVVSKVIFMFPAVWLVWRKHDIRLSIGMHVGTTLLMAGIGTVALALNLV
jgi:membrane protease YdiL (CAAX protease family)